MTQCACINYKPYKGMQEYSCHNYVFCVDCGQTYLLDKQEGKVIPRLLPCLIHELAQL